MTTHTPPPTEQPSRIKDGFAAIARAIWFVLSLMLYTLGVTLRLVGNLLVRLSGWEQRQAEPPPTSPPPRSG